ncbi:MAG TPA: protein-glutamate O-methyltransferase CheR [bacterium]|nr:protein-glutamate O-methyltransferase CheR [bacterium]HPN29432.1 protein-glutamate O-methyltransferase CheR [bacterium]
MQNAFWGIKENDRFFLNLILDRIYQATNFDFRDYRESTLYRRISRRFYHSSTNNFEEYYNYLGENFSEYNRLIKDLTINVTEFYRDLEYWDLFQTKIVPELIVNILSKKRNKINVWSAGCASGEETYSLGILIYEYIKKNNLPLKMQITGTDIACEHLETAVRGIYSIDKINFDCIPEVAKKYILPETLNTVAVSDEIKKNIHFDFHSLVSSGFLENVDLIVCRNVFIYFTKPLQNSILKKFYNSLNSNGILWLGKAESISTELENLFVNSNNKNKFYKKNLK